MAASQSSEVTSGISPHQACALQLHLHTGLAVAWGCGEGRGLFLSQERGVPSWGGDRDGRLCSFSREGP